MPDVTEIPVRDPFIVTDAARKRYVMFGTNQPFWTPGQRGFSCYESKDLKTWSDPMPAWVRPDDFWADRNFWAPEVHRYRGKWYLFASFKSEHACRATQIFQADDLTGPYRPLTGAPVTPEKWECLDGTLSVDEAGAPWIVFCHEWVQIDDGTMCAAKLTEDLHQRAGEPVKLFNASDAPWGNQRDPKAKEKQIFVTDGPFLYRTRGGKLIMIWSSFGKGGYAIGIARSTSGQVTGPWEQQREALVADDGGHGMIFRTLEGDLRLALHRPNGGDKERAHFLPLVDTGESVRLA